MNLYWVTTEDHAEDWFVLANSAKEAATFHEDAEGYAPGNATAEQILEIPGKVTTNAGWPSDEILKSCGAKFISEAPTRVVEIGNRKFCEGLLESTIQTLEDDMFEEIGEDHLNKTERPTEH
jgi:hypothetical protein